MLEYRMRDDFEVGQWYETPHGPLKIELRLAKYRDGYAYRTSNRGLPDKFGVITYGDGTKDFFCNFGAYEMQEWKLIPDIKLFQRERS
jgi:hypothetical protein